jgi:ubiquinone/menaquinone biosynthesis C-methylase UbiE
MKNNKETNDNWKSYDKTVGATGHYYHQSLILPKALELLNLRKANLSLLDLGCGQGVLARHLPEKVDYLGIDASTSLVRAARKYSKHKFMTADVSKPLDLEKKDFTHATLILALQNIKDPLPVLTNAANHLKQGAKLLIVLNHPCFRIPRQSSWGIDEGKKLQYRRVDRYFSPLEISIQMRPSQNEQSAETQSYHYPLSSYCAWLKEAGFCIELIEEWCSDKKSMGKMATMENRARQEFPLFLTLLTRKN